MALKYTIRNTGRKTYHVFGRNLGPGQGMEVSYLDDETLKLQGAGDLAVDTKLKLQDSDRVKTLLGIDTIDYSPRAGLANLANPFRVHRTIGEDIGTELEDLGTATASADGIASDLDQAFYTLTTSINQLKSIIAEQQLRIAELESRSK